jgi:hypothetical protein
MVLVGRKHVLRPTAVLVRASAAALAALSVAAPAWAADPAATALDRTAAAPAPPRTVAAAQDRLRRDLGARALLQKDPATATPRIVARLDGFLTGPSGRDPAAVALDYVGAHATAFGLDAAELAALRPTRRSRAPDGTVELAWEQRAGGLPSVDGGLEAAVTADGRLINVRGGPVPRLGAPSAGPAVSASAAYATADPASRPAPAAGAPQGAERRTAFAGGGSASLVLYRDGGDDRLGWRVLAPAGSEAFYDALVDAGTGRLERRVNRVHSGTLRRSRVNPRTDVATLVTLPPDWLSEDGTGLDGPYAHAVSDLTDHIYAVQDGSAPRLSSPPAEADEVPASSGTGTGRSWSDSPNLTFCAAACSWSPANREANRRYSAAQLFWYVNSFHAHLAAAPIGFTGAGAFENDDRILAQALDGASTGPDSAHLNNANMLVLPDGFPGLMQMYLFGPVNRYDGAMDASVVYHEYAHGLSERLVTDAQGYGALDGAQAGALSEGTSDFYAMDYLVGSGVVPDSTATQGEVQLGRWLQTDPDAKGAGAVRTEGLDCTMGAVEAQNCPGAGAGSAAGPGGYDYGDFGRVLAAPEAHADGEIWAQTLWDVRRALVADYGAQNGLERTRAYVTGGLRLAPDDPSFLDMRNAIVQAAVAQHGTEDWTTLWQAFALRGMGWSAATTDGDDVSPVAAFDVPPAPGSYAPGAIAGTVTDEGGSPLGSVTVAVGGHDSGLSATDLSATTGPDGRYRIANVPPGGYGDVYFRRPGFADLETGVQVAAGVESRLDAGPLRRDWASFSSGGSVSSFSGPNYDAQGCGPGRALDDDSGRVWSTTYNGQARDLVIDLGRAIDLRSVRIDPRAGCGDGPGASLAQYQLFASDGAGQPYEALSGGGVGALDARGYATLPLAGDVAGRRLLLLRALAPRTLDQPFMDVAEVEVTGTPVPVAPPQQPPAAPPAAPAPATATAAPLASIRSRRVTATRKGYLRVKVHFGSKARRGTARLQVRGKRGRVLAAARARVRAGRTVTVKLRLNRRGRKAIPPGKRARVTLRLVLPGGHRVSRRVTVARARR